MTAETLTRNTEAAVKFFESKLAFEMGPVELGQQVKNKQPLQVVDLRTPELFQQGHVPGAININYEQIEQQISKLSKDKMTVVYCYDITCHLAAKAALALAKKGYQVKELVGGWQDYVENHQPVEGKAERIELRKHQAFLQLADSNLSK